MPTERRRLRLIQPGDGPDLPPDPRDFYIRTPRVSLLEVVRRYKGHAGASKSNLTRRKSQENWDGLRARFQSETDQRTREKLAESRASMTARHMQTAKALETMSGTIESLLAAQLKQLQRVDPVTGAVSFIAILPDDMLKLANAHKSASASVVEAISLQRELVGEKDDRVADLFRAAEEIYKGSLNDLQAEVDQLLDAAEMPEAEEEGKGTA